MVRAGLQLLTQARDDAESADALLRARAADRRLQAKLLIGWRRVVERSGPGRVETLARLRLARLLAVERVDEACSGADESEEDVALGRLAEAVAAERAAIDRAQQPAGERALQLWKLRKVVTCWLKSWRGEAVEAEANAQQLRLAAALADAAAPGWQAYGDISEVDMALARRRAAVRWWLRLGGVHALRAEGRRVDEWRKVAERRGQQEAMRGWRRTGTLSGNGGVPLVYRRHAQHGLGRLIDVGAAQGGRRRRATRGGRGARQRQVDAGEAADRWGRWRVERVVGVERRQNGRGARSRWAKVQWAGTDPATGLPWPEWWLPWRSLSAAVKQEASALGGWAVVARGARDSTTRRRATTARAAAVAVARLRATGAAAVLESGSESEPEPYEAGWKRGRRVLKEPGEGVRRRRGRGEVELRAVRRIAQDDGSGSDMD